MASEAVKQNGANGHIRPESKQRESWPELERLKGAAKSHTSDEQLHEIREKVFQEYAKKFDIKSD